MGITNMMKILVFFSLVSLVVVGCDNSNNEQKIVKEVVKRDVDYKQFSAGQRLFQKNCAVCHGKNAQGAKDWRKRNDEGKNPAPPLNGTGHTWHHSYQSLTNTIKNGTVKIGGNMPAWGAKLSNDEIKLILTWITAQWPDEIYSAWYNRFYQQK